MRKLFVTTLLFVLTATAAMAGDKALFVVNEGALSTRLLAANKTASAVSFTYKEIAPTSKCYNVTLSEPLAAHKAALYRNTNMVCDRTAIIAAPANLDVKAIIAFDNGKDQSSSVIPPVGAVTIATPATVGPVVSDDEMQAYITGYAREHTALTVEVFDGDVSAVPDTFFVSGPKVETFEANAGLFQYKLAAQGVVYLRVSLGYKQLGIVPSKADVYGFVSNATPRNSNAIILPFGE